MSVIRYRLRTDGGDPSKPLTLTHVMSLLRSKLLRHPGGKHYRVDGGRLHTRLVALQIARAKLARVKVGYILTVDVDVNQQPGHTYTVRKVTTKAPIPVGGAKLIAWCEDRIGTPYVWAGESDAGMDCSGMTKRAVAFATENDVILPHNAAAQADDPRVLKIALSNAVPGDLFFFNGYQHVAAFHHIADDGTYWVIDEEPGTEIADGKVIYGGLRIRPCYPGYYVGMEFLSSVGRVVKVNGQP